MEVYLLNLSLSGVKNIEKEIHIDFYPRKINKSFDPSDYRVKGIFGANGSGKTAIITAVNLCKKIVTVSHYLAQDNTQKLLHELINKNKKAATISMEFLIRLHEDGEIMIFTYTVTLAQENGLYVITHEGANFKNGNTATNKYYNLFEVDHGTIVRLSTEGKTADIVRSSTMNLLGEESFINRCIILIRKQHMENTANKFLVRIFCIYSFFALVYVYLEEEDRHRPYLMQNQIEPDKEIPDTIRSIQDYPMVHGEIRVHRDDFKAFENRVSHLEKFVKIFKTNLKSIDIERKEDEHFYLCALLMNYGSYRIDLEFESTGIRKIVRIFDGLYAADHGFITFIDEMDANINSIYLDRLIEYFTIYSSGQLIFTSHNLDPMYVLSESKCSIDFLSPENEVVSWIQRGNAVPANYYRNGMIQNQPFNVEAEDFIRVFGD